MKKILIAAAAVIGLATSAVATNSYTTGTSNAGNTWHKWDLGGMNNLVVYSSSGLLMAATCTVDMDDQAWMPYWMEMVGSFDADYGYGEYANWQHGRLAQGYHRWRSGAYCFAKTINDEGVGSLDLELLFPGEVDLTAAQSMSNAEIMKAAKLAQEFNVEDFNAYWREVGINYDWDSVDYAGGDVAALNHVLNHINSGALPPIYSADFPFYPEDWNDSMPYNMAVCIWENNDTFISSAMTKAKAIEAVQNGMTPYYFVADFLDYGDWRGCY